MIIEHISISSFGRLQQTELDFTSGVNLICGKNESGKSTVAAFIKFIFYGTSDSERPLAVNWVTKTAAGSLTLFIEPSDFAGLPQFQKLTSRRFRMERTLVPVNTVWTENVRIFDVQTGSQCFSGENPGELFFGVDADLFASTAFIRQAAVRTDGGKTADNIKNLLFSADESVNTEKALAQLNTVRKRLLGTDGKSGRIFELDGEIAVLNDRLQTALQIHDQITVKEAKLAELRRKFAAVTEKTSRLSVQIRQFEVRTIAGLFTRMHALEKRIGELSDAQTASPSPPIERMKAVKAELDLLQTRADDLLEQQNVLSLPPTDELLEKYILLGGRDGIEHQYADLTAGYRAKLTVAVSVALIGTGMLVGGLCLPHLTPLCYWLLVGGGIGLALALTLFLSAHGQKKKLSELSDSFDLDELERREQERHDILDKIKSAQLAHDDAETRYRDAVKAAQDEFGDDYAYLDDPDALVAERQNTAKNSDFNKYTALLESMREHLGSYDEADTQAAIDLSVSLDGVDAASLPGLRREAEFAERSAASLEKLIADSENVLAGLYPTAENLSALTEKLQSAKRERADLAANLTACSLAADTLTEAADRLHNAVMPQLAADAAATLAAVTDNRYTSLDIDGNFRMTAADRELSLLSHGTQDAAYLSLRMALTKLIFRRAMPPLICDESFSSLDDERMARLLSILAGQHQTFVFSSTGREAVVSPANRVTLG